MLHRENATRGAAHERTQPEAVTLQRENSAGGYATERELGGRLRYTKRTQPGAVTLQRENSAGGYAAHERTQPGAGTLHYLLNGKML